MHYHILLTERCNSECKYCYEKSMKESEKDNKLGQKFKFDFTEPVSSEIDVKKLREFLKKDKDAFVIFYGGEPLLEIEKLKEIIDNTEDIVKGFRMQTNGKLLDKLHIDYMNKISKILISLDGDKQRTDVNRGKGTYELVMSNIEKIKKQGYKGELIARMVISQPYSDIYEQVINLIKAGFRSIHWQLDAGFYKFDYNEKEFSSFVDEYNKSISKLIDFWINDMKMNKRVLKLYPFIAIAESLLKNEKTLLRCGSGHKGYSITTNGKIIACPIMNCIKDFEAGDLNTNTEKLKKFYVGGDCINCDYYDLCGGRCLYANKAELWPKQGNQLICKTIKHLIDSLKMKIHEIKSLIKQGIIKQEYFSYEKYFGPEIIP